MSIVIEPRVENYLSRQRALLPRKGGKVVWTQPHQELELPNVTLVKLAPSLCHVGAVMRRLRISRDLAPSDFGFSVLK